MKIQTLALGLLLFLLSIVDLSGLFGREFCSITCTTNFDGIGFSWGLIILISFVFAVVLEFLSEKIYNSWWSFNKISIPVVFIFTTIINLQFHHTPGGFFNLDNLFDIPLSILSYLILILGSLIQIYRGYRSV